jgi:hypothetical protein
VAVVRMPKYQKLRNELDRSLQQAVRRKFEQQKSSTFWAFLNSAIFIWFLTSVVLASAGGYITSHQQCMKEANETIENRAHLLSELQSREEAIIKNYREGDDLRLAATSKVGSLHSDLANLSYEQLYNRVRSLNEQVENVQLPDPRVDAIVTRYATFARRDFYLRLRQDRLGEDAPKVPPVPAPLLRLLNLLDRDLAAMAYLFGPNCTIRNTVAFALGYNPKIVSASISPVFFDQNVRAIFEADADQIEQLEKQLREGGWLRTFNE